MSEELTTQAVVDETKAPAQPGAAETNARETTGDDLDTLLSEYKPAETRPPETPKPEQTGSANETKDAAREVLDARDEIRRERFDKDMNDTIAKVRGDMPKEYFDDDLVRAYIDGRATKDTRLADAWINRMRNPQQFAKVVEALGRDFAKKYGKLPDKNATEDREAVTAAVRGASTKAPEGKAPDYSKMTDAEFAAEKERLGM